VQIRQDFLEEPDQRAADPGRPNLTWPIPTRETSQQPGHCRPASRFAVSALALANQSNQSVLQPAALISANYSIHHGGGASARAFFLMWWIICGPMFWVGKHHFRLAQTPKVWRERTASSLMTSIS
jgi:hypothetical protein